MWTRWVPGSFLLPATPLPKRTRGRVAPSSGRWRAWGKPSGGAAQPPPRPRPRSPATAGLAQSSPRAGRPRRRFEPKPGWASPAAAGRVPAEARDPRPRGHAQPAGRRGAARRQSRRPRSTGSLGPTGSLGLEPSGPSGRVPAPRPPGTVPAWNAFPPQAWAWLPSEARLPSTASLPHARCPGAAPAALPHPRWPPPAAPKGQAPARHQGPGADGAGQPWARAPELRSPWAGDPSQGL